MSTSTTSVYEDILDNIDADKKAWCKDSWCDTDEKGKPVSRCLVEHIDLAVGTTYIKPNGKVFVSKDPRKWNRRERILQHLFELMPKKVQAEVLDEAGYYGRDLETRTFTKDSLTRLGKPVWSGSVEIERRPFSEVSDVVVTFNDADGTTKTKVRNLLKRAAKRFPED